MKFRKKPVEIEAHQWWKNGDHPEDGSAIIEPKDGGEPSLSEGNIVRRYRTPETKCDSVCPQCGFLFHIHGWIDTLEGGHIVCPGDWVITGIENEKYPCKPGIFNKTYKRID